MMQSLCEQVYACMPVLSLKNLCAQDPGPFPLEAWSGGEEERPPPYSAAQDCSLWWAFWDQRGGAA